EVTGEGPEVRPGGPIVDLRTTVEEPVTDHDVAAQRADVPTKLEDARRRANERMEQRAAGPIEQIGGAAARGGGGADEDVRADRGDRRAERRSTRCGRVGEAPKEHAARDVEDVHGPDYRGRKEERPRSARERLRARERDGNAERAGRGSGVEER